MSDQFLLEGEIDPVTAPVAERELLAYVRRARERAVIDCSGLTFIDSSGLRMLVNVQHATAQRLVLTDVPDCARRLLVITGLNDVFEVR
jgi:anti-anti-sigma factor